MLLIYRVTEDDVSDDPGRPLPRPEHVGWWAVECPGGNPSMAVAESLENALWAASDSYV